MNFDRRSLGANSDDAQPFLTKLESFSFAWKWIGPMSFNIVVLDRLGTFLNLNNGRRKSGRTNGQCSEVDLMKATKTIDIGHFLREYGSGVHLFGHSVDGDADLFFTIQHRPVERLAASVVWKGTRMVVDTSF